MLAPDGSVRGGVMGFGRVYPDLLGIVATRSFLEAHPVLEIPAMNRAFVEAATHPETRDALAADLGQPWGRHTDRVRGTDAQLSHTTTAVALERDTHLEPPCTPGTPPHATPPNP